MTYPPLTDYVLFDTVKVEVDASSVSDVGRGSCCSSSNQSWYFSL